MTVGIARPTLYLPESASLKDKRAVVRRVKDRVRQKFNAAIAEVEDNDIWQRAVLGLALCGNEAKFVASALDEVIRFVEVEAQVTNIEPEVQTYSDALGKMDLRHWEP